MTKINTLNDKEKKIHNQQVRRDYYLKNRETIIENSKKYMKEYRKDPENNKRINRLCRERYARKVSKVDGRKSFLIRDWKKAGLKDDPQDVYEIYKETTHCTICDIELTSGIPMSNSTKVMNHCHATGYFNNILCNECNWREHVSKDPRLLT
jgi:intein/homing endonuclease